MFLQIFPRGGQVTGQHPWALLGRRLQQAVPPAPAPSADAPPAARSCPGELPARPQQPPGPGLWARRHLLTDPSSSSEFLSWFGRARAELAFQRVWV